MAEENRAERTGDEGHADRGEGQELLGSARRMGKEQLAKHQSGGCGVDVEIVKLDRSADQTGRQNAARRRLRRSRHIPSPAAVGYRSKRGDWRFAPRRSIATAHAFTRDGGYAPCG